MDAAAHRAGLPLPQVVGQLQGGVFPQQGLLPLQPQGEALRRHLLLLRGRSGRLRLSGQAVRRLLPLAQLLPGEQSLLQPLAALQQPGELLGRLLAPGHELLPRLQPGGQVLPLLHQSGQAGLLRLLGLPGLLGLPADLPGPPQLLLALGELGGLLGQRHCLPPQGSGLLPLPLGGLVGLLRLLVPLPGGGQGPGRRDLPLSEPFPLLPGLQKGLGPLDALPQGGVFLPQGLDLPRLLLHRLGQGLRDVLALLAQQGLPQGGELPGLLLQGLGPLLEPLLHVLPHLGGEQSP